MDISTKELSVFLSVAQAGTITGAASQLGLTQPAVSRSVQKLERELESKLMIRSRSGVVLTRAGKRLAANGRKLLCQFDNIQDLIRGDAAELRGTFSIGVHADLAGHTVPKFTASLLKEHPALELNFEHHLSRDITRAVVQMSLDFGIVVNPVRFPDLVIHQLYTDQVGFWAAANSRFPRDLKADRIPVICHPELHQTSRLLRQVRRRRLFPNMRVIPTTHLQLIADLTASDSGIGIMPQTSAELHHKGCIVHLKQLPVHKDRICLIYRKDMLHGTAGHIIKQKILDTLSG